MLQMLLSSYPFCFLDSELNMYLVGRTPVAVQEPSLVIASYLCWPGQKTGFLEKQGILVWHAECQPAF